MTFALHPDLETIFGTGATRLAIGFDGIVPDQQQSTVGGKVSESVQRDEESLDWSDEVDFEVTLTGQNNDKQGDFQDSTPKKKRPRGRSRNKGSIRDPRRSSGSISDSVDAESGIGRRSESNQNSILISDTGGNESKKIRLDDVDIQGIVGGQQSSNGNSVHQSGVLERDEDDDLMVTDLNTEEGDGSSQEEGMHEKDEDDILGVTELDTVEGDGSSQEDGMSSGATRDTFLPGSPGLEGV